MNARVVVAAVVLGVVACVAMMVLSRGGPATSTPMQDEAACVAHDEAACARRRERMRVSCEAKEVKACVDLADAYYTPMHAPKDDGQAAHFFDEACKLDSPRGCHMLSTLKASGRVGPRDVNAAQELEEKACRLGEPQACQARAKCLEHADAFRGCREKDLKHAQELYRRQCELEKTERCEEAERLARDLAARGM